MPLLEVAFELLEPASLVAHAGEWRDLFWRTPAATPFQSPDWLIPWARHFGRGSDLRLAVLRRDDGRLAALLPMVQTAEARWSLAGEGVTDYLGGCAEDSGLAEELLLSFAEFEPQSAIELAQLRWDSPFRGSAANLAAQDWCPVLDLPVTPDEWEAQLQPGFRERLAYAKRRAEREFKVEIESAEPASVTALLRIFFDLHRRRWTEKGGGGVLEDAVVRSFHLEVADRFARAGLLRLHLLRFNGVPAAAFYGFRSGAATFFYLSGFDPAVEKFSPGMLILDFAIRAAIGEGCSTFDFLRGQEPYKYRWGGRDRTTFRRTIPARRNS